MIIIDLFDIDFHIFTVKNFLFNLGVRFKYIYFYNLIKFYYLNYNQSFINICFFKKMGLFQLLLIDKERVAKRPLIFLLVVCYLSPYFLLKTL